MSLCEEKCNESLALACPKFEHTISGGLIPASGSDIAEIRAVLVAESTAIKISRDILKLLEAGLEILVNEFFHSLLNSLEVDGGMSALLAFLSSVIKSCQEAVGEVLLDLNFLQRFERD